MTTYDAVLLNDTLIATTRMKNTTPVHIVKVAPLILERKVNEGLVHIIPLFPDFRDEQGEYGARKEANIFEAILPFGDNRTPPRREPLEIPWTRTRS